MNRREFLKTAGAAGMGSIALASLPALPTILSALASRAAADGQTNFHFLAFSKAGPAGTPESPQDRVAMSGDGNVTPSQVLGGGTFVHFLFPGANPPIGGTPLTIVASGTWKARRLVSADAIGTWGEFGAGIVEMEINLVRDIPSPAVIPATLKMVCNIGPAGISTGQDEGFTLAIPGTPFAAGGTPGPFVPLVPFLGLTVFTTGIEQRD